MKKLKVYLASGWFKPGEAEQEEVIYNTIKSFQKFEVFSPRRCQMGGAKSMFEVKDNFTKIMQFDKDCEEIDKADIIIADYTFRDSGTIWEIGYGCKAKKPILTFDNISINKRIPNLMISFCSKLGYTNTLDTFKQQLDKITDKNFKTMDERKNWVTELEVN